MSSGAMEKATIASAAWSRVVCPLCKEARYRHRGKRYDGASVVECAACHLLYLNPQPGPEVVHEFYREGYFERDDAYQGNYCETHGDLGYLQPVWKKILGEIRRFHRRGRILDIGCAHGFFLCAAARHDFEPYGVELVPEAVAHARRLGLKVVPGDLLSARFPSAFFDVVTMLDVIEHLPDPVGQLEEVRRVLRPDGLLCLLTPNARQVRVLGMRWKGFRQSFTHLLFFDPHTIRKLLARTGFELMTVFTMQPNLETPWVNRFGRAFKVDYFSVVRAQQPSSWRRLIRRAWGLSNRAVFWVPEALLFGHILWVLAKPASATTDGETRLS